MCGRFVSRTDAAMERAFNVTPRDWRRDWVSYNVAPTQPVPVVRMGDGVREGVMLRWGLIPAWAHGEPTRYSTINARVESLSKAASYRRPWARGQRCLIPALGFYEWRETAGGRKQPYFIRLAGGEPFGLCGLWEASRSADGALVETCTIITVPANPLVAAIHARGRMPAMLLPGDGDTWLEGVLDDAGSLLRAFPEDEMDAYPVSPRVNSPRNDTPELIAPLAADDQR